MNFICYLCGLAFPDMYKAPHPKIPCCTLCMEKVNRLREANRG